MLISFFNVEEVTATMNAITRHSARCIRIVNQNESAKICSNWITLDFV